MATRLVPARPAAELPVKTVGPELAGSSFFAEAVTPSSNVRATLKTCSPRVSARLFVHWSEPDREASKGIRGWKRQAGNFRAAKADSSFFVWQDIGTGTRVYLTDRTGSPHAPSNSRFNSICSTCVDLPEPVGACKISRPCSRVAAKRRVRVRSWEVRAKTASEMNAKPTGSHRDGRKENAALNRDPSVDASAHSLTT